jgi:thymidylate synthase ThyX
MTGNIRDFIFYIKTRTHESTQLEHRLIANQIKEIFKENLPIIYSAVFD